MRESHFHWMVRVRIFLALFGLLLCHGTSFSQNYSLSTLMAALPSTKAQLVFEEASLANHQMSSYRLVTKLSPERLIAEVEGLWSKNEKAKVWRTNNGTWLMVSKVERFPALEVLQAKVGLNGETIARLSVGAPSPRSEPATQALLMKWLPTYSTVLQSFASSDHSMQGHLLIARSRASLQSSADWILDQAKRAGFKSEPHLKANFDSGRSLVALLARQDEEVLLTLDETDQGIAIVLQQSRRMR
jgi:hypothetical protein